MNIPSIVAIKEHLEVNDRPLISSTFPRDYNFIQQYVPGGARENCRRDSFLIPHFLGNTGERELARGARSQLSSKFDSPCAGNFRRGQ